MPTRFTGLASQASPRCARLADSPLKDYWETIFFLCLEKDSALQAVTLLRHHFKVRTTGLP